MNSLVEFRNISKTFGDFTAVDNISLEIEAGEFFALLGPSGCGKTTLLRMLAGFETPSSGSIFLDGKDISDIPANLRPVNMMFQSYALFPHLSVEQNIAFGLKRTSMEKSEIFDRTNEMLKLVHMEEFSKRKPHQLSGGQRQRVALARSLAKNPKLLLLDEPLGALDAKLREATQFELVNIQESLGTTFIIVTHDQEEAMTVATRIGIMDKGKIKQIDTPPEVYENPNSRFVADFIGDVNLLEGKIARVDEKSKTAKIEIEKLGVQFSARNENSLKKEEKANIAVRPEKITISKTKPKSADNLLKGVVEDIAYSGNLSTYHVKIADGTIFKTQGVNERSFNNRDITWEEEVWLSWNTRGGLLLAE